MIGSKSERESCVRGPVNSSGAHTTLAGTRSHPVGACRGANPDGSNRPAGSRGIGSRASTAIERLDVGMGSGARGTPSRWAVRLAVAAVLFLAGAVTPAHAASGDYRVPASVQGEGVVLQARPPSLLAKRNVNPPSLSGYDGIAVRWKHWGGRRSVGSGTYYWHSPNQRYLRRFAVRVKLVHPRGCDRFRIYQRIRVHFKRKKPPRMGRSIAFDTLPYDCSGGVRSRAGQTK